MYEQSRFSIRNTSHSGQFNPQYKAIQGISVPRFFFLSISLSESSKQPRHMAEICFTLLYASICYITLYEIFQKCGTLQLMFLQTDVTGKNTYIFNLLHMGMLTGKHDIVHCRRVFEDGLQTFTTSAHQFGHCHTANALLTGK
jgi:hypothetical protein